MAEKDALMAKYLKAKGITPPSRWPGTPQCRERIALALAVGKTEHNNATWERGMLGGVLTFKAGLSGMNPME